MDDAYPDACSVSDRTIDSHVKRIRRKFIAVDPRFRAIEGVYGAGYRYHQGHGMRRVLQGVLRGSALRLLAFNLLVVFVPVVGVLYLDVYEARLLEAQEREIVQQARLVAAASATAADRRRLIERAFHRLERQRSAPARLRRAGALLADSRERRSGRARRRTEIRPSAAAQGRADAALYRWVRGWRSRAKRAATVGESRSQAGQTFGGGSRPAESGSAAGAGGSVRRRDAATRGSDR